MQANLTGTGEPTQLVSVTGLIEDLAVDWTTGNLYWTLNSASGNSHVAMVNARGDHYRTLVTGNVGKPRGIALHPVRKYAIS